MRSEGDSRKIRRRQFLFSTSALATGAVLPVAAGGKTIEERTPGSFRSLTGSLIPFSKEDLKGQGPQRTFTGAHLTEIAFPLGGIGTGTVSLGGRGQLRDWEIFNRPGKNKHLPYTFVAIWTKPKEGTPTVKLLEAAPGPPFTGAFGYERPPGPGLPHLKAAHFTGAYPLARIDFEDDTLPVKVSLEAFNPFIPLNVEDSGLPVTILHYHLSSHARKPVEAAISFSILNAVGYDGVAQLTGERHAGFGKNTIKLRHENLDRDLEITGLSMSSEKYDPQHPRFGSMALVTTHRDVTARTMWDGESWWDPFESWWNDFSPDGSVDDIQSTRPSADGYSNHATLVPRLRLLPGESRTITFILAWYFPVRENYWNRGDWGTDEWEVEQGVESPNLRNDYGKRFASAWEVGRYTAANLNRLENTTRKFQTALFSSSLPNYVLDAVSSQVSTLRTNTCILLEGKQFFAFEGCGDDAGSAPMNCTHVWNYEQTLAFLFPELERSMRPTDFGRSMLPDGSMAYRALVPGVRANWKYKPAADGQMGCILKLFREWQVSGDDDFLQRLWPQAKRALEYAWVQWDRDRDGVMEGEQRNTYDTQLYGPNTMMGTLYLGALKAGELMASAVGEKDAAEVYRRIHERGRRKLEDLWNGEYYIQKVASLSEIENVERDWNENWRAAAIQFNQIPFQYG